MQKEYTDAQIKQYIREVVREAKNTAKYETGYLQRSIKGALIGKNKSVEFRQIFYGAYNGNSKLVEIATRIMPNDINWKVIFEDEDGRETTVKGQTRTGRTVRRSSIGTNTGSTSKIKQLLSWIKSYGRKAKDSAGEADRAVNKGRS